MKSTGVVLVEAFRCRARSAGSVLNRIDLPSCVATEGVPMRMCSFTGRGLLVKLAISLVIYLSFY